MSAVKDEKAFDRISSYVDIVKRDSALTVLVGREADRGNPVITSGRPHPPTHNTPQMQCCLLWSTV